MKKITPISRTDIVQQIQNKFGSEAAKSYDSGEQTLGDILRSALISGEKPAGVPSPHRDFNAEEAQEKTVRTITMQEMKQRILDGMTARSTAGEYFKKSPIQKDYSVAATRELTGGKVNYYLVKVDHPQREEQKPYQAECEDIIRALGMNFDEGCLFKALWRSVNARNGNGKPGLLPVYDAEKMVHYANRILKAAKNG